MQRSTIDGESATERPLSRLERLGQENTALKAENASLLKAQGGEHLFDPKNSTDHEIAVAMIGRLGGWRGRARRIAKLMLDILDERAEPKRGGATR